MFKSVEEVIQQVDKLPIPNTVAFEVIQMCADKEIPIPRLVKVISGDQSLSSQILRVANSSYFNYPRDIYSLDRAIVILGFNLLRDIAVSLAIYSVYKGFKAQPGINLVNLWKHSLLTAFALKSLADNYDPDNKDILYIGGLLHDIGKLAMIRTMSKDYALLMEKSSQEQKRIFELEMKYFGFNHEDVGASLLSKWNLPENVVTMIKYHHHPADYSGQDQSAAWIRLVYLGNLLAYLLEQEDKNIKGLLQLDPNFENYFTYSDLEITELLDGIGNEIQEQKEYFRLFEIGSL